MTTDGVRAADPGKDTSPGPDVTAAQVRTRTSLTSAELATAREMADWFMPATPGFPSSREADPDESVLHLVLEQLRPVRAQLAAAFDAAALDAAAADGVDGYLSRLREQDSETYELLRVLFVGRYLTCRPVWRLLGYDGRRPHPIKPGEAERDLDDDILGPTVALGKIYRPTPTATEPRSPAGD